MSVDAGQRPPQTIERDRLGIIRALALRMRAASNSATVDAQRTSCRVVLNCVPTHQAVLLKFSVRDGRIGEDIEFDFMR